MTKIKEIVQQLTPHNCIRFAIFAAEKVIHVFEEKYPDSNDHRKAINAAIFYILEPTFEAYIAAYHVALDAATNNPALVNTKEAYAAYAASKAAYSVATPRVSAASAAHSAIEVDPKLNQCIIDYGLLLIKNQ